MHWRGPSGLYFCDHRKRIWSLSSVCHVSLKNLNGSKSNIRLTGIVQPMAKNSYSALALTGESFSLISYPFDLKTFKYCSPQAGAGTEPGNWQEASLGLLDALSMETRGSGKAAHFPLQMSKESTGDRVTLCVLVQFSLEVVHVRNCLCRPI